MLRQWKPALFFNLFFTLIQISWIQPVHARLLFDFSQDEKLLTKQILPTKGLRLLWWNIHHGQTSLKHPNLNFTHNLLELIHDPAAPDVLSFAEYADSNLDSPAHDLLPEIKKLYPYSIFAPYPDTPEEGVITYSRYPLQTLSLDFLDFVPPYSMSDHEKQNYRHAWCGQTNHCTRPLQVLNVKAGEKTFTLVPVHLFDCWRKYKDFHGKIKTLSEIIAGDENPLFYQATRLRTLLDEKLKAIPSLPRLILYGDFNVPEKLFALRTRSYSLIAENLIPALSSSFQSTPSFPSRNSEEYWHFPKMQIDHGFVLPGTQVNSGIVLRLKGSDHYPLYFILD